MKTIWQILDAAGGINAVTHMAIENPPFERLAVEILADRGPGGYRAVSIVHYGELNGDLMRDPEVCAEVVEGADERLLWPYYFRNDYAGVEQICRWRDDDGNLICLPERTRDMEAFLAMWDRNLHEQGFPAAYLRAHPTVGGGS